MLVIGAVCVLISIFAYLLRITEPKILPEWAYSKFFGLQVTEIASIVFLVIAIILFTKMFFSSDR